MLYVKVLFPLKLNTSMERGEKSINPTSSELQSGEPNRFCQEPSAHHRGEGKGRKSESATLNVKVFFPDRDEETRQLQSWSYRNGRCYFGNGLPNMTNQTLLVNLVLGET